MQERLGAYLERIGLDAAPAADAAGLSLLQSAHRQAIAFENLDVLLGVPLRIGSGDVFAKLVAHGRGGYCFEQNRLYADMLGALGIPNRPLLARPRLSIPPGVIPPRTHVLLLAQLEGADWVADAGFGGSFVPTMPLADGAQAQTPDGARHRLRHIGSPDGEWLLERAGPHATTDGRALDHADWQMQYTFDLAQVMPVDLDQANHWTSTWPESRFIHSPIVSRVLPTGFAALSGTSLSIVDGEHAERRDIGNAADWRQVLVDIFGIELTLQQVSRLPLFTNS